MATSVQDFLEVELTAEQVTEVLEGGGLDRQKLIDDYLWDGRVFVRRNAALAIKLGGEVPEEKANLLPVAAKDSDPIVREHAIGALGVNPVDATLALDALFTALGDTSESVRGTAIESLDRLVEREGEGLVPLLLQALGDSRGPVRSKASELLVQFAEPACEPLVRALAHSNQQIREESYSALLKLGVQAADPLIAALTSDVQREAVMWLLIALPGLEEEQREKLTALLKHRDSAVREATGRVLEDVGTAREVLELPPLEIPVEGFTVGPVAPDVLESAEVELPLLLRGVQDTRWFVRANSIAVLAKQIADLEEPERSQVIYALAPLVRDEISLVRVAAVESLGLAGGGDVVGPLLVAVSDANKDVSAAANRAFRQLGPEAASDLITALTPQHRFRCHYAVIDALASAGEPATQPVAAVLAQADRPLAREIACEVLRALGPQAQEAIPTLIESLADESIDVRRSAAEALGFVVAEDKGETRALKRAASDPYPEVRQAASYAIARIKGEPLPGALPPTPEPIPIDGFYEMSLTPDDLGDAAEIGVDRFLVALKDGRPTVRANAALALGHLGASEDENNKTKITYGLAALVRDGDVAVRRAGVDALVALAVPAIVAPLLVVSTDSDDELKAHLRTALAGLGPELVPAMLHALEPEHPEVYGAAVMDAIISVGASAVTPVTEVLDTADRPFTKTAAVTALGALGPEAASAVPSLLNALKDPSNLVRRASAAALPMAVTEPQDEVVAALQKLTSDTTVEVRREASRSLMRIRGERLPGEAPPPLTPIEVEGFEDTALSAEQLKGAAGDVGVERLIQAMDDGRPVVRTNAATALGTLGKEAVGAAARLAVAVKDGSPEVRAAAAAALGELGEEAIPSAVPSLVIGLGDRESAVVDAAAASVEAFGVAALPALAAELDTDPARAEGTVLKALAGFGEAALEHLIGNLDHLSQRVRLNALRGIGLLGKDITQPAREAVQAATRDPEAAISAQAQRTLDTIDGVVPPPAVLEREAIDVEGFETEVLAEGDLKAAASGVDLERLIQALDDGRPIVRLNAVATLGLMGKKAVDAGPELAVRLKDSDRRVRVAATAALAEMGGDLDEGTLLALVRALNDPEASVVEAARAAVEKVGEPTLPAFAKAIDCDPGLARIALLPALVSFGDKAIDALAGELDALSVLVRANAVTALGMLGPEHAAATRDKVLAVAKDPDERVRRQARWAVDQIDGVEPPPRFLESRPLPGDDFDAQALAPAQIKKAAGAADTARLQELLFDGRAIVRENAARCLGSLGKGASDQVPYLIIALKDSELPVRKAAAEALGELKHDEANSVPALTAALYRAPEELETPLIDAVSAFGKKAVEPLMGLLGNRDSWVLATVGRLATAKPDDLVKPLADAVSGHQLESGKFNAIDILGMIGPGAQPAEKALTNALDEKHPVMRAKAVRALAKVGKVSKALEELIEELSTTDGDYLVQRACHEALQYLRARKKAS